MFTPFLRGSLTQLCLEDTKGKTQNNNESLHSVIWSKCPKTNLYGLQRVQACMALAIGEFNMGTTATTESALESLGLLMGKYSRSISKKLDNHRLQKSDKRDEEHKTHMVQRLLDEQKWGNTQSGCLLTDFGL
jgi:hypothetical protein